MSIAVEDWMRTRGSYLVATGAGGGGGQGVQDVEVSVNYVYYN
jgi:hypothetical protein